MSEFSPRLRRVGARSWGSIGLSTKLLAIVVVSLIGTAWFGLGTALDKRAAVSESAELNTLVNLSTRIGDLLHETQKERGATAVFMSSQGERFGSETSAQQRTTDGPRRELLAYVEDHRSELPDEVSRALQPALAEVARLDATRRDVSGLARPTREVIGYFTNMNGLLLQSIASIGSASSDADLRGMLFAYLSFLNAKENAGIERAQLANVFGEDQFAEGQFALVVSLIANQKSFLSLFEQSATPETLVLYNELQGDPLVSAVAAMENTAVSNGCCEFGIDSAEWFTTMTARINLLKQIEDQQSAAILSESDRIASAASAGFRTALIAVILLAGVAVAASLWMVRRVVASVRATTDGLKAVAEGDLSIHLEPSSGDEVGEMATALNTALGSIGDTLVNVDHSAADLTSSASDLMTLSHNMAAAAGESSTKANEVAASSTEIASSARMVASAMKQMNEAVHEISSTTSSAAATTAEAVESSSRTKARIETLDSSAKDIGDIVGVISSIAAQTDLLALNATIEAARVGEAGKGFAVVANEVKALSQETSGATEQIQARIEAIQNESIEAVAAISEITDLVAKVDEAATTIAGAVEQQAATVAEVSKSIATVTNGTETISDNIDAVAGAAATASAGAEQAQSAATHLTGLAENLNEQLDRFTLAGSGR